MHYALGRRISFTVRSVGKKAIAWIVGRFAVLGRLAGRITGPGGNRLNARELYQSRRLSPPGPSILDYRSVDCTALWSSVGSSTLLLGCSKSLISTVAEVEATIVKEGQEILFRRHGFFADPDGYLWEVTCKPSFPIAADGSIELPN
jgi:catechol 2,3-dioxygenase-like lactoylglutathione lyase family enzyme